MFESWNLDSGLIIIGFLKEGDRSPTSSGREFRERRSPSKVYEDSLIMERKIKSFGLFSEDLSWILMGLLKDNEDLKNIIKVGFKEIEREMSEIDESNRKETSIREAFKKSVTNVKISLILQIFVFYHFRWEKGMMGIFDQNFINTDFSKFFVISDERREKIGKSS